MIVQLRLDERLIHGQITTAWSRYLEVNAIVVVSDKLVQDKLAVQKAGRFGRACVFPADSCV